LKPNNRGSGRAASTGHEANRGNEGAGAWEEESETG
jgi:hypothetical protein